jgi:hypothetical protein
MKYYFTLFYFKKTFDGYNHQTNIYEIEPSLSIFFLKYKL